MANKKFSEFETDASPKESGKGGMLNNDGREMGSAYNKSEEPSMSPKHTFDPNEDAPSIASGKLPGVQD